MDDPAPAPQPNPEPVPRPVPAPPPVVGPTRALRGRPGGPGFQPPRPASGARKVPAPRSPWQASHRLWSESEIPWEQDPANQRPPREPWPHEAWPPQAWPQEAHPDAAHPDAAHPDAAHPDAAHTRRSSPRRRPPGRRPSAASPAVCPVTPPAAAGCPGRLTAGRPFADRPPVRGCRTRDRPSARSYPDAPRRAGLRRAAPPPGRPTQSRAPAGRPSRASRPPRPGGPPVPRRRCGPARPTTTWPPTL